LRTEQIQAQEQQHPHPRPEDHADVGAQDTDGGTVPAGPARIWSAALRFWPM